MCVCVCACDFQNITMPKHRGIDLRYPGAWMCLGRPRLRSFRISSNQKTWDEIRPGTGKGEARRSMAISRTNLLEVPIVHKAYICKAYVREDPRKIWSYMVQYLQFRILKLPLRRVSFQAFICPR